MMIKYVNASYGRLKHDLLCKHFSYVYTSISPATNVPKSAKHITVCQKSVDMYADSPFAPILDKNLEWLHNDRYRYTHQFTTK